MYVCMFHTSAFYQVWRGLYVIFHSFQMKIRNDFYWFSSEPRTILVRYIRKGFFSYLYEKSIMNSPCQKIYVLVFFYIFYSLTMCFLLKRIRINDIIFDVRSRGGARQHFSFIFSLKSDFKFPPKRSVHIKLKNYFPCIFFENFFESMNSCLSCLTFSL